MSNKIEEKLRLFFHDSYLRDNINEILTEQDRIVQNRDVTIFLTFIDFFKRQEIDSETIYQEIDCYIQL